MKLLIVGIDPGTTSAYAAIDLDGKIVSIKSSKEYDLSSMIADVIEVGKVIIVGCDKKNTPSFVDKFRTQFGAKIISPKEDLKNEEKRSLVKKDPTNNAHEFDALASAYLALKEYKPLIAKVKNFINRTGYDKSKLKLFEMVIKDEMSIKLAADILRKPKNKDIQIIKEIVDLPIDEERKKLRNTEISILYEKLKNHERTIQNISLQNKKLKKELSDSKKVLNGVSKKLKKDVHKKGKELAGFSKKQLRVQKELLNSKDKEMLNLRMDMNKLNRFLSRLDKNVLIKRVRTLGWKDFEETKKISSISDEDILLVDKIEISSEKTFKEIKDKIHIILFKGKLPRTYKKKPFIFINVDDIKFETSRFYAQLPKTKYQKLKDEVNILDRVVESYREEREE